MSQTIFRPQENLTGKDLYAFTLASFLVAQNRSAVEELDGSPMDRRVLESLTRSRTIQYWKEQGWLELGDDQRTACLTASGVEKSRARVQGQAKAQSVTPAQVEQWRQGILSGQLGDFHWVAAE